MPRYSDKDIKKKVKYYKNVLEYLAYATSTTERKYKYFKTMYNNRLNEVVKSKDDLTSDE